MDKILSIGTKCGCLTIVDGFQAYRDKQRNYFEALKNNILNGKVNPHVNITTDYCDKQISELKNIEKYKCKCKCGKIHYLSQNDFLKTKHRYCTRKIPFKKFICAPESEKNKYLTSACGMAVAELKKNFAKSKRIYDENYDIDFSGKQFESLEILDCIDDNFEKLKTWEDMRKPETVTLTVYKRYKCKCYLCGKETEADCSQFRISAPTAYGNTAYHGYWGGVSCDCHQISSFQWIVNKILIENNIPYKVEKTFPDLYGIHKMNLLSFDFCIFNDDGSIKALFECQGEQHYKPVEEFGGDNKYQEQLKNDELKKKYAKEHNIKLIEIPYTSKKVEQIEKILKERCII